MTFRDRFRREFRNRAPGEPSDDDYRLAFTVRAWADGHPESDVDECRQEFRRRHKSGTILVTLTLVLIVVEIIYFIKQIRRRGAEDSIDEAMAEMYGEAGDGWRFGK